MKKVRSIVMLSLIVCLAVSMSACSKVKPLTEGATTAPSQAPVASVESPCAKVVQASPTESTTTAEKSWKTPPAMSIDTSKTYCAVVQTSKGSFTLELFAKDSPKTVNNFVFLAKNNFYNGIVFHRIIKTFMIQTGDPTGTGTGGPGYQFEDELTSPYQYEEGVVAMANSGPNTNGSQFFINTANNTPMDNLYSKFGKVVVGMDTVKKIAATPVVMGSDNQLSSPTEKVTIDSVTIVEK
jgi:cyclophilin family peptidyl-prolyl cis-trans isomerase